MTFRTFSVSRPTRLVLAVALALTTGFTGVIAASANLSLLQLSSDPYTNTTSQHQTEVEPDAFAFGSTIVSAFQVGRFFDGGASNIGFATSTNSGTTWKNGFLPGTTLYASPAGSYARVSDPSVAFDAKHNVWIVSYLGLFPQGNTSEVDVLVSRSTDGRSWGAPVVVNNDGHFNDKNWTVCDDGVRSLYYGNCYTEFDDNSLGDLIQMSTSGDGGSTWGLAQPTANAGHGIGGQPVVQSNGTVIVPIVGFSGRKNFLMLSFTSTNGGATWGPTLLITRIAFHNPAGGIRGDIPLPSAEIDGGGTVYLVWSDCNFEKPCLASDLVLSTTSDGAQWSPVTRIPLDPKGSGVDHFIPGLGVDRTTMGSNAHLALTFYYYSNANCTTATCQLNVGSATSPDGGASWTATRQIAGPMSLTWLPSTTLGRMVGDYISTSFSGARAYPAFATATSPNGTTFNEPIDTVDGGLVAGASAVASDQTAATTGDPQEAREVTSQ